MPSLRKQTLLPFRTSPLTERSILYATLAFILDGDGPDIRFEAPVQFLADASAYFRYAFITAGCDTIIVKVSEITREVIELIEEWLMTGRLHLHHSNNAWHTRTGQINAIHLWHACQVLDILELRAKAIEFLMTSLRVSGQAVDAALEAYLTLPKDYFLRIVLMEEVKNEGVRVWPLDC